MKTNRALYLTFESGNCFNAYTKPRFTACLPGGNDIGGPHTTLRLQALSSSSRALLHWSEKGEWRDFSSETGMSLFISPGEVRKTNNGSSSVMCWI